MMLSSSKQMLKHSYCDVLACKLCRHYCVVLLWHVVKVFEHFYDTNKFFIMTKRPRWKLVPKNHQQFCSHCFVFVADMYGIGARTWLTTLELPLPESLWCVPLRRRKHVRGTSAFPVQPCTSVPIDESSRTTSRTKQVGKNLLNVALLWCKVSYGYDVTMT